MALFNKRFFEEAAGLVQNSSVECYVFKSSDYRQYDAITFMLEGSGMVMTGNGKGERPREAMEAADKGYWLCFENPRGKNVRPSSRLTFDYESEEEVESAKGTGYVQELDFNTAMLISASHYKETQDAGLV